MNLSCGHPFLAVITHSESLCFHGLCENQNTLGIYRVSPLSRPTLICFMDGVSPNLFGVAQSPTAGLRCYFIWIVFRPFLVQLPFAFLHFWTLPSNLCPDTCVFNFPFLILQIPSVLHGLNLFGVLISPVCVLSLYLLGVVYFPLPLQFVVPLAMFLLPLPTALRNQSLVGLVVTLFGRRTHFSISRRIQHQLG